VLGYQTGVIGGITSLHAHCYAQSAGSDIAFETRVASDLCEFAPRLRYRCNQLWTRWGRDRLTASIAIDGQALGPDRALLRWFLVHTSLRGLGIGRAFLSRATSFCDEQGMKSIELWTFDGLDMARGIYEEAGFAKVEERQGDQWGRTLTEHRFVRLLPESA